MNPAPSALLNFFRNSWISIPYFRYTLKRNPAFVLCPLVRSTGLADTLTLLSHVQHISLGSRIWTCSVKAVPCPTTQLGVLSRSSSVLCVAPLLWLMHLVPVSKFFTQEPVLWDPPHPGYSHRTDLWHTEVVLPLPKGKLKDTEASVLSNTAQNAFLFCIHRELMKTNS